jgi:hypothetical protein
MIPDASKHNPDPAYLRELIGRAGLTQNETARRIKIGYRTLQCYLADTGPRCDYRTQFALECLAKGK